MKVLIDEDLASRELVARLRNDFGDDVLEPVFGDSDEVVWARAQTLGAALLTGNAIDFLRIARQEADHAGLLLVYRTNDRTTDMKAADIAQAVLGVHRTFPDGITGLTLAVNDFRD